MNFQDDVTAIMAQNDAREIILSLMEPNRHRRVIDAPRVDKTTNAKLEEYLKQREQYSTSIPAPEQLIVDDVGGGGDFNTAFVFLYKCSQIRRNQLINWRGDWRSWILCLYPSPSTPAQRKWCVFSYFLLRDC